MAASTVVALPTIVMFVIFQKRIIESIKTTGIK
jgi:multiple sugar transport system permease protein